MKSIIVENIEVVTDPFDRLTFDEATNYCQSLNNGYRLPTKLELETLLEYRDLLNLKEDKYYWSSETIENKGWCLCLSDDSCARVRLSCHFPFFIVRNYVK